MSYTYAIGDIQGCYEPLRRLLEALPFDKTQDRLWFVGDLVNRGPNNLDTLNYVRSLGDQATTVLGNHDLHLLAIVFGGKKQHGGDTMDDVLDAPNCEELCDWLRSLPLMYVEPGVAMVHAGIPHIWSTNQALELANEVESVLRGPDYVYYFENMYGRQPDLWLETLEGMERHRNITNYLTRMRFVAPNGQLEFAHKTTLDDAPEGFQAWFQYPRHRVEKIVFGHWAALDGDTDSNEAVVATDTGCVWGRGLTAVRLEDWRRFQWCEDTLICLD